MTSTYTVTPSNDAEPITTTVAEYQDLSIAPAAFWAALKWMEREGGEREQFARAVAAGAYWSLPAKREVA